MAQLFRVTNFRDTQNTWTFSFILPPATISKDGAPEILSREFVYAGHKWRIILSKRDKLHLSPYLEICGITKGLTCTIDYTFFLINWDSYTQNEKFTEKQRQFTQDQPRHGARIFLSLDDLSSRVGFTDIKQHFVFELTIKSPKTYFETQIGLSNLGPSEVDCRRYDADRFRFGDSDWQAVFCPNMDTNESPRHLIQLQRIGRSDTLTKLRYVILLGYKTSRQFRSKIKEEIFDFAGSGEGIYFNENYQQYVQKASNVLLLRIELYSVTSVTHLKLCLVGGDPQKTPSSMCMDKDRQSWRMLAHTNSQYLALNLIYSDMKNIPSGYLRYVCWSCRVMPSVSISSTTPSLVDNCPLEQYYAVQSVNDKGVLMKTRLTMSKIVDNESSWLDKYDGRITIEIDWLASYLLVNPVYSSFDDITRRHVMQMRRELEALQSENYSLERELHNYQMSISSKCASQVNSPPETHASIVKPVKIEPQAFATPQLNRKSRTIVDRVINEEGVRRASSTAVLDNWTPRDHPNRLSADAAINTSVTASYGSPHTNKAAYSIPSTIVHTCYDIYQPATYTTYPYYACNSDYRRLSYDVSPPTYGSGSRVGVNTEMRNGYSTQDSNTNMLNAVLNKGQRRRSASTHQNPFGELTPPMPYERRLRRDMEKERRASYAFNPYTNYY